MSVIWENDDGSCNYNGKYFSSRYEAETQKRYDEERQQEYYRNYAKKTWQQKNNDSASGCLGYIVLIPLIIIGVNFGFKGIIFSIVAVFVGIILISCAISSKKRKLAQITEAWNLYSQGRYTEAYVKAKPFGDQFDDAATLLAFAYFWGQGCTQDYTQALNYASISKKKNPDAQAIYGMIKYYGMGCSEDKTTGKKELLWAMTKGSDLALLRYNEIIVNENNATEKNVENLNIAGEKNLDYAYFLLAEIFLYGNGEIEKNEERGFFYMEKAANLGVQDAIDFLEKLNTNGQN